MDLEQEIENLKADVRQITASRTEDIYWLLYFEIGVPKNEIYGKSYIELYHRLEDEIRKLQGRELRKTKTQA